MQQPSKLYYAGSIPAEDALIHTGTTLHQTSVEFAKSVASTPLKARKTICKAHSATSYRKSKENTLQSRISEKKAMQEQRKDTAKQQGNRLAELIEKDKLRRQNGINAISVHKGHFLILISVPEF